MRRFRFREGKDGDWRGPWEWEKFLRVLSRNAHRKGAPYRLKVRGGVWGRDKTWPEVREALERRVKDAPVGEVFYLECGKRAIFNLRVVAVEPMVVDTAGTPDIDRIFTEVTTRWRGKVESWGICNCRRIAGSSVWSYHSWCQAWDIHASTSVMDEIARWLRQNAERLNILHVLWRVPDHFDHIHLDVGPARSGTPPCAQ